MLKMLFAIEILAMCNFAIAIKKNRTLAEFFISSAIIILTNYLAWQV